MARHIIWSGRANEMDRVRERESVCDAQRATVNLFKRLIDRKKCWIKVREDKRYPLMMLSVCITCMRFFLHLFFYRHYDFCTSVFFLLFCTHALLFSTSFFTSQQCFLCFTIGLRISFVLLLHLFLSFARSIWLQRKVFLLKHLSILDGEPISFECAIAFTVINAISVFFFLFHKMIADIMMFAILAPCHMRISVNSTFKWNLI